MNPLRAFSTYRAFLLDLVEREKRTNPAFTLARFAESIGLSVSALSMILSGKRNLQTSTCIRLSRLLQWDEDDLDHFDLLVRHDDATDPDEKALHARRLEKLKGGGTQAKHVTLHVPSASLLERWFYPAVLVSLLDVVERTSPGGGARSRTELATELSKRFPLTEAEATGLLAHMEELGVLDRTSEGEFHIHLSRLGHTVSERNYIRAVLQESSRRAADDYRDPTCYFTAAAFSLPSGATPQIVTRYKEWLDSVASCEDTPRADRTVYQSAFVFFPVENAKA